MGGIFQISPQNFSINHFFEHKDVTQIFTKTNTQQKKDKNYQTLVQNHTDKCCMKNVMLRNKNRLNSEDE